jgi:hypothetical protein
MCVDAAMLLFFKPSHRAACACGVCLLTVLQCLLGTSHLDPCCLPFRCRLPRTRLTMAATQASPPTAAAAILALLTLRLLAASWQGLSGRGTGSCGPACCSSFDCCSAPVCCPSACPGLCCQRALNITPAATPKTRYGSMHGCNGPAEAMPGCCCCCCSYNHCCRRRELRVSWIGTQTCMY